mmetsp:Transcript_33011/g.39985  ORF Transcript_33011/g.39985 Transcript_33011/m.39985 type:complete len:101 (-) Transcript_33011:45-347(-)
MVLVELIRGFYSSLESSYFLTSPVSHFVNQLDFYHEELAPRQSYCMLQEILGVNVSSFALCLCVKLTNLFLSDYESWLRPSDASTFNFNLRGEEGGGEAF